MAESGASGLSARAGAEELTDTRAIKARLLSALGERAEGYWAALGDLCTAAINREEFQARVAAWLPEEYGRLPKWALMQSRCTMHLC